MLRVLGYTVVVIVAGVVLLVNFNDTARELAHHTGLIIAKWVFWSRWTLLGVTVLVLATVVMIGNTRQHSRTHLDVHRPAALRIVTHSPAPITNTTAVPTRIALSPSPTPVQTTPRPSVGSPVSSGVPLIAVRFVTAWGSHKPKTAWLAAMKPYATTQLLTEFTHTDPAVIPNRRVTGHGTVKLTGDGMVQVSVPTNRGAVLVVMRNQAGWRAAAVLA